ncbi:MAG: metallophosphoesterase [Vulcanimicrobiota bacterium]
MNNQMKSGLKNRRKKIIILSVIIILLLLLVIYPFYIEPGMVRFEHHDLYMPNLPENREGATAIQLTDLHLSESTNEKVIEDAFLEINRLRPDIILMTGDYVTKDPGYTRKLEELLKLLKKGSKGKLAVLGNHDRWIPEEMVIDALSAGGFTILINENKILENRGGKLYIAGIDDFWTGKPDFDAALKGIDLDKDAVIFLSHNPNLFFASTGRNIPVMLAGHTHGGQVKLPLLGAPILPTSNKLSDGFYRKDNTTVYINSGLGQVLPAARFLYPPEITVFTLKKGNYNAEN